MADGSIAAEPCVSLWLSRELQIGKAAEHLVCAELILRGFNAFLADAGQPYDLLVDTGTVVLRLQVKATRAPYRYERSDGRTTDSYRFGLRKGRRYARIDPRSVDVFAFVALDSRRIAFLNVAELLRPDGRVAGLVEFCDEVDDRRWGTRTFQRCVAFPPPSQRDAKPCFRCGKEYPATAEHFALNKRCRGGINGICRTCSRTRNTAQSRARRSA
jgi:hypothetical protein